MFRCDAGVRLHIYSPCLLSSNYPISSIIPQTCTKWAYYRHAQLVPGKRASRSPRCMNDHLRETKPCGCSSLKREGAAHCGRGIVWENPEVVTLWILESSNLHHAAAKSPQAFPEINKPSQARDWSAITGNYFATFIILPHSSE